MHLDVLFRDGRITTMDPSRPRARAVGVLGGLVVGLDEELDGCTAEVVHDLHGAPVVPGLHDAHHHLSGRGQDLLRCDVSPATVASLDALYAEVARYAASLPADAWVLATGYDDTALGGHPTRAALDAAAGGRPVWVAHASHHAGVVSTEAIRRMGFADPADLPDVPGGLVARDAEGTPTGLLAERALDRLHALIRPAPADEFLRAIEVGAAAALADGLTSVTEPGVAGTLTGNAATDLAAFQAVRDRGRLGVRVTVMPELAALHPLDGAAPGDEPFGVDLGLRTGFGDDHLRVGAVKVFGDGALTARTAALRADYTDRPGERGLLQLDPAALRERIVAAHLAGWQVATHAIGDAAIDAVLDAYEEAQRRSPRPDARHRIEHCGLVHDDQLSRFRGLGVVPVPQGRFLTAFGDGYLAAIGPERERLLFRQRAFLDAGLELPGSSDCPVVDGSPLAGIEALVTRRLPSGRVLAPQERLTVSQALRAFTLGSAYADHQEDRKGSLGRGKLADLVVLSDDPHVVDPDRIGAIEVVVTVVGGEALHGAEALATV
jgi:predicted amidohydrolase YtcJ